MYKLTLTICEYDKLDKLNGPLVNNSLQSNTSLAFGWTPDPSSPIILFHFFLKSPEVTKFDFACKALNTDLLFLSLSVRSCTENSAFCCIDQKWEHNNFLGFKNL